MRALPPQRQSRTRRAIRATRPRSTRRSPGSRPSHRRGDKAFHAKFYGASHAELAIVGDFDPAAMRALVTELFGGWKSPTPYARVPDPLVPQPARRAQVHRRRQGQRVPDRPRGAAAERPRARTTRRCWSPTTCSATRRRRGCGSGCGRRTACPTASAACSAPNPVRAQQPADRLYAIFAPENLDRVRARLRRGDGRGAQGRLHRRRGRATPGPGCSRSAAAPRSPTAASPAISSSQAYLDRTWSRPAAVDPAIEKLTPADVNAVLRKYLKPAEFAYAFAGDFK